METEKDGTVRIRTIPVSPGTDLEIELRRGNGEGKLRIVTIRSRMYTDPKRLLREVKEHPEASVLLDHLESRPFFGHRIIPPRTDPETGRRTGELTVTLVGADTEQAMRSTAAFYWPEMQRSI